MNPIRGILLFALLAALWPAQQVRAQDSDGDGMADDTGQDYAEVFSAGDSNSGIVYINWQEPQATNDFPRAAWFLGAYRFFNDGSLVAELKRGGSNGLTNNLRYALDYVAGTGSVLYINLLNTNGVVLAASEDLLTSSNVDHYVWITDDSGIPATNTVLLVNVPTAEYPEAVVIQLIAADDGLATVEVGQALLYIDDGDFWTADYSYDSNGNGISDYAEWLNSTDGGSSTNPPDGGGGTNNPGGGTSAPTGFIYVDQTIGSDVLTGRVPEVRGNDGPKKTISKGMAAVERDAARTMVIKSGNYGEDLDIRGKGVAVIISGNVRL